MSNKILRLLPIIVVTCMMSTFAFANNLTIKNVQLGSRDPKNKTVVVSFDLGWENSWRNKINHDAVWATVRLNNASLPTASKQICLQSASGLNPAGSSVGSSSNLEMYVPADKTGVLIRQKSNGPVSNIMTTKAQLTIKYDTCSFSDTDKVIASVFGLEMVLVPQGAFYAGDNSSSTASLNKGSADANAWYLNGENAISVTNATSNGFRYVSNANSGEYATGATFTIPATYPKGYMSFYVMKYEITEGQWVEFINSIEPAARLNRDITDDKHKNSDAVISRNTIACSGSPITCTSIRPSRAVNFLSWMDLAAFLDWAALRPMTELEFEKASRGPQVPVAGEYVWGNTEVTAAQTISSDEDGTETITTPNANAHFNSTVLLGGDSATGPEYQAGPLRGGIFATSTTNRVSSGSSYYGVMDLSGNVKEHIVTVGNASGLSFSGLHGDGKLTSLSAFEGNADVTGWPGFDTDAAKGVTAAAGSGFKGGSWAEADLRMRTSDRDQAALATTDATALTGGRGVRTYDLN